MHELGANHGSWPRSKVNRVQPQAPVGQQRLISLSREHRVAQDYCHALGTQTRPEIRTQHVNDTSAVNEDIQYFNHFINIATKANAEAMSAYICTWMFMNSYE